MNADYRGAYELQALANARRAGVPADLCHPAGWNGDESELTGYFAEQIYLLGDAPFTAPDTVERLGEILGRMLDICRYYGVNPREAIPYAMPKLKRQLFEAREHLAAIARGEELPLCDPAEVCWQSWANA